MHKILIIDDEMAILKMLQRKLSGAGFIVETAESGEEGLTKIDSNQYSLILTDMRMPGISGIEIFHYIRDYQKSSIPVIAMSGTPWLMTQIGFDAILPKPCSPKKVKDLISLLLKNNGK